MVCLFASSDMSIDSYVQYGCFGLMVLLFLWMLWKGLPSLLATHEAAIGKLTTEHKEVVAKLVESFERNEVQCRDERLQVAKDAAAEREKDRATRHELMNKLQVLFEGQTARRTDGKA